MGNAYTAAQIGARDLAGRGLKFRNPKSEIRNPNRETFGLRHSFGFRHSSFVIALNLFVPCPAK